MLNGHEDTCTCEECEKLRANEAEAIKNAPEPGVKSEPKLPVVDNTAAQSILDELKEPEVTPQEAKEEAVKAEKELEVIQFTGDECEAFIAVAYQIPPMLFGAPDDFEFPDVLIKRRGRQLHLIMVRYKLAPKYLDILFFGAGIASDMSMCYRAAKDFKEHKEQQETSKGAVATA